MVLGSGFRAEMKQTIQNLLENVPPFLKVTLIAIFMRTENSTYFSETEFLNHFEDFNLARTVFSTNICLHSPWGPRRNVITNLKAHNISFYLRENASHFPFIP